MNRRIQVQIQDIDLIGGPRLELAIEQYGTGSSLGFHDIEIRKSDSLRVECAIQSSWTNGRHTPETALADLRRARGQLDNLLAHAPDLASSMGDAILDFVLIDDYGMGSVELWRASRDELK